MGQNLMTWTAAAGSRFEDDGPRARVRRQVDEVRRTRTDSIQPSGTGWFATLAAFAVFGALDRPSAAGARVAACCAAA